MAKIPTYNTPMFQAEAAPVYVPNTASAWNTVLGVASRLTSLGSGIEDKEAQREGEKEGLARQYEAGTSELTKSEDGLFGPTVRGAAADKGAEMAFAALKKQQAEQSLYEIEKNYGHDPKQFGDQVATLRQNFLSGVPLDKMPTFQSFFDDKALGQQRVVDTAAQKQKQAENLGVINGRLDGLITRMGNSMSRDWYANSDSIMSDAAEIDTILGEATKPTASAGPLIGPDKAQEYREKLTDAIGKNYAYFLYDRASPEERKTLLSSLRGGTFTLPELGREGNKLVEKGREIPIESARKIASEIETAYAKKSSEGKLEMAMLKLALGEQTAATTANQQAHPEIKNTLTTAMSMVGAHPELLDDIRKANVAVSVANDVRPYLYRTGAEIAAEVNRVQEGIVKNSSKDVFRDTEYVKALREMQAQKQQAEKDGTEVEFLHRRGLVPESPYYDVSNATTLESGRAARLRAEAITGRQQPMLDDRFINSSKETVENGTAQDRANLLRFIGQVPRTSEERQRMFNQLGRSNPELGQLAYYFGAMKQDGEPDTVKRKIATDSLAGLDFYKQNPMDTAKEQQARHMVNIELGRLVSDPNQVGGLSRMAFGLMVDNARVAGQLGKSDPREFTAKDARQAVGRIIGANDADLKAGRIPSINEAATVPFERGMSESDMRLIWRSLNNDTLKAMNGGKLPLDSTGLEVDARKIMDRGQLRYVAPGQYQVIYTDPGVNTSAYPARDPLSPLLSGRVSLGRSEPFLFRFDDSTRDALWAATKRPR